MSKKSGYRGYIISRPVRGVSYPHRVQNLVIRDYATRHHLAYKLSATEYAMPSCYMILHDVLGELQQLDGIILFSLFTLPQKPEARAKIYDRLFKTGCQLHAALEEMVLETENDIEAWEEMINCVLTLPHTPLAGYYQKTPQYPNNAFFQTLSGELE